MKVLYVLFFIALVSCEQLNNQNPIFINDANELVNNLVTYTLCGTNEYIDIVDFSPKHVKTGEPINIKVNFKANKNVNIKKLVGSVLIFSKEFPINKNLVKDNTFTFEYTDSLPSELHNYSCDLYLKLYDDNNKLVYCAKFKFTIETKFKGQLSYTTCGSTDYLEISDYSPKEINPGDSIVAKIAVKAKQDLEATKIHYDVQYIGMTLLSGDVDISVSLKSGESYSQEQSADVPAIIPPGQYNIIAKAYNSAGTELYCANFQIIF
jgi:hypothetical protein